MRLLIACGVVAVMSVAGCTSRPSAPAGPTSPMTLAGTWVGGATDSTASMMGTGMGTGMPGSGHESLTWHVTQTGSTFAGTMQLPGHHGGTMTVSGHVDGHIGTFTMTVTAGAMMMGSSCGAVATGTFEMNEHMNEFHGFYAGTSTCLGHFDHGHVSLVRR